MLVLKYRIWCHLLYNFPFSSDFPFSSFLWEILHVELSGKAEVNHMDAFLLRELQGYFLDAPMPSFILTKKLSALKVFNFKFGWTKICLQIKTYKCFTDGIALFSSEIRREFGSGDK